LLFDEHLFHNAAILARPAPLMRHLIAPQPCLSIAFRQRSEGPAGPEGMAPIANGSFHAPFLIAGAHLAGPSREVVVGGQFDQTGVEQNFGPSPLQYGGLEVVVQNGPRLAVPGLESMHMTTQEVLRRLIEEELQIQGA
jgi:hypothetical protein